MTKPPKPIVGGGFKKVLYTLQTAQRMGLTASAKALTAKNACKACGLGMGGQRGGMTNELDEFPSVCNKSVQAQSTDIQPAIPLSIFDHPISELQELDGYEVEHLGRLNTPLYKAANATVLHPISWEQAFHIAIERFKSTAPERSFFYASGRSSNEAGYLLQLFARAYGTNNVNNCSYFCHQATGVGLQNVIGTGTATVTLADLALSDVIFVVGANPASNHPRLIHSLKKCRDRGGKVIVINPAQEPGLVRFALPKSPSSLIAGGHEIASHYLQPRVGSDIYVFMAIAKVIIDNGAQDDDFITRFTRDYANYATQINALSWAAIIENTGLSQSEIEAVAAIYSSAKQAIFCWGMGLTHHLHGVENIESLANLALLRGMVGKPGAGLLPLRGHSNVQGMGTIGVKPTLSVDMLDKLKAQLGIHAPTKVGMDTMACLEAADRNEIDFAFLLGGNILEAAPSTQWAKNALNKIGCKIFLTTTLNRGHLHATNTSECLILPVAARDEEPQATTQESMFSYVRLSDGGINRLNNVKSEVDIIANLASAVIEHSKADFSVFSRHNTLRSSIAKVVTGLEGLSTIDETKNEFHIPQRHITAPCFQTEDELAHFVSIKLPDLNNSQSYPLRLVSIRSEGQFNTIIYEANDSYRGTQNRSTVLMNQQDMQSLGLIDGDKIKLESPYGELCNLTVTPFNVAQGAVLGYYPETNVLVGREVDPRSRTPAYKSVPLKVVKNA